MTVVPATRSETSSLIRLRPDQARTISEAISFVRELGGRVVHAFSPHVLLGVPPPQFDENEPYPLQGATEDLSENERLGLDAWTLQRSQDFVDKVRHRPHESVSWEDVAPPDPPIGPPSIPPDEAFFAAAMPETSAYLIGTVAVGIIFVDGPDQSLRFTEAERIHIAAKVQAGLGWLAAQEPRAEVSWVYDYQEISISETPDKKRFGTEALESLWRDPVLAQWTSP